MTSRPRAPSSGTGPRVRACGRALVAFFQQDTKTSCKRVRGYRWQDLRGIAQAAGFFDVEFLLALVELAHEGLIEPWEEPSGEVTIRPAPALPIDEPHLAKLRKLQRRYLRSKGWRRSTGEVPALAIPSNTRRPVAMLHGSKAGHRFRTSRDEIVRYSERWVHASFSKLTIPIDEATTFQAILDETELVPDHMRPQGWDGAIEHIDEIAARMDLDGEDEGQK